VESQLVGRLLDWHWRPEVILVLAALGAAYVHGFCRLRARSPVHPDRVAPRWRLAVYLTGLASLAVALLSPLERLAETLFTAHMVQHQALLMVAPPLLLLGNPFPVVLWGCPRALRQAFGRVLTRGSRLRLALRRLTWMPVAGALYALNLTVWHLPAAYEAALRHHVVHDVEHLLFFGTALLFWWPVVNPAPRLRRLSDGFHCGCRIAYLVLATALNTLVGAALGLSERVLYPTYEAAPRVLPGWSALDDQAFGGGVMWSGSHMFLVAILVLLHQAMGAENRVGPAPAAPAERAGGPP
jgi:cytochrome c oxidase assembly factor CtaG